MSRLIILYLLIISTSINSNLLAQENESFSKINFLEANVSIFQPLGPLKRNLPQTRLGLEIGYLRQLEASKPLFWGISTYYTRLESASATLEELLDFALVDFDYTTTNHMAGLNGKLRFYPDIYIWNIELYAEAQLGTKLMYTTTSKTLSDSQDNSDTSFDNSGWSLTYGISAGLNYPIKNNFYINLRANYLPGLSTSYYKENPTNTIFNSTVDLFDLKNSTTDIIRWDIGVTFWPSFTE